MTNISDIRLEEITTMGLTSQRNATLQLELVTTRLASIIAASGSVRAIDGTLEELRAKWERRPLGRQRRTAGKSTVAAADVLAIVPSLRAVLMLLTIEGDELRRLREDVRSQHDAIRRHLFTGELVVHDLATLGLGAPEEIDPAHRDIARDRMAARVEDLRIVAEAHDRAVAAIDLLHRCNGRLGDALERLVEAIQTVEHSAVEALAQALAAREEARRLGDIVWALAQTTRAASELTRVEEACA